MAIWGSSFPAFKYILAHLDGWFVVWIRMVVASAITLLTLPFIARRRLNRDDLKWLAIMALCEPCLYFIFETRALQLTSSAQAGIIVALLPLIVACAAGMLLGESITRRLLLGMLLAVMGAIWMSLAAQSTETSPHPLIGNIFEFCAMICATGYIIAVKKLSTRHTPLFLVAIQCWIGALFFLPFAIFGGGFQSALNADVPINVWILVLYLSTVVSLGAFYLYNLALRQIPACQASVYGNLIPAFAFLLGFLFLGESLSTTQIAGASLILIGLFISHYSTRSPL